MKRDLLKILVCPNCKESFELKIYSEKNREIHEGILLCKRCDLVYPVFNYIPRILPDIYEYSEFLAHHGLGNHIAKSSGQRKDFIKKHHKVEETFGYEWMRFDVQNEEIDKGNFLLETGFDLEDLRDKLVLDAGCGSGRYTYIAGKSGARVVSIELSRAVEKAREINKDLDSVDIIQADIFNLPFREGTFDYVFSIGVLQHTPDALGAFNRVASFPKNDGRLSVRVYRKCTLPLELINTALRSITKRLPHRLLTYLSFLGVALGAVPLLKHLNMFISFSSNPNWKVRLCDTFNWYAPPFQSHHTEGEVKKWFSDNGFKKIESRMPKRGNKYFDFLYRKGLIMGSGVYVSGKR